MLLVLSYCSSEVLVEAEAIRDNRAQALAVRIVPRVVPERVLPPAARGEQKAPATGRPAKRMRCCESERRQVLIRIIVGGGRNDSRRGSG